MFWWTSTPMRCSVSSASCSALLAPSVSDRRAMGRAAAIKWVRPNFTLHLLDSYLHKVKEEGVHMSISVCTVLTPNDGEWRCTTLLIARRLRSLASQPPPTELIGVP